MKKFLLAVIFLTVLMGCQKEKTPDLNPPKGGSVEYYYEEGEETGYGGMTPMSGPYSKPERELEEKCNHYVVHIKDENGKVIRSVFRYKLIRQWTVSEICEDGATKITSYDEDMNFLMSDLFYYNEQNKPVRHQELNKDGSVALTEITVYLEDGMTQVSKFVYNEKGQLELWYENTAPDYNEFTERDVKDAPEEYRTLK